MKRVEDFEEKRKYGKYDVRLFGITTNSTSSDSVSNGTIVKLTDMYMCLKSI